MNKQDNHAVSYKIVLIGDSAVGKTSLINLYNYKEVNRTHIPTLACDYFITNERIDGQPVKLLVWDTAGQERFRSISTTYVKNARGILIIYSVTDRNSFNNVTRWLDDVVNVIDDFSMILVGNKSDLAEERKVSYDEGKKLANEFRVPFYETTIYPDKKPGHAVEINEIFVELARMVFSKDKEKGMLHQQKDKGFGVDTKGQGEKRGCRC